MAEMPARVLVVDDEESMRDVLSVILGKAGYAVQTAASGEEALSCLEETAFELIFLDLRMPGGMEGMQLLEKVREENPQSMVVMVTAYSEWEYLVEAMRLGAYDYVVKPFNNDRIRALAAQALQMQQLRKKRSGQKDSLQAFGKLVGNSPSIQQVMNLIRRVAPTNSTVLIRGESGTGKELVARALHFCSLRADEPFLAANCGAFTETLLESELFGHVRGSFTGAVADKKGLLEVADRGTFFLDEVGEMSPATQVKFLRVLEDHEFKSVGSPQPRRVDVRFVTATNRDLEAHVEQGTFREDLYYRLNVISIELPRLRDRREDIPLLGGHFLAKHRRGTKRPIRGVTPEAMAILQRYDWPGNIREFENTIQRAVALCDSDFISPGDLPPKVRSGPSSAPLEIDFPSEGLDLEARLADIEKQYLVEALQRTGGRLTRAAELLGLSLRSIRYKVKKYGIPRKPE